MKLFLVFAGISPGMTIWTIHFLGVPGAIHGEQQAHLRSKETWAVLASLIIPAVLRQKPSVTIARETVADRFWYGSEKVDPKTHLRQCLSSLRAAFGAQCLRTDRLDLQIVPGWFNTDIGEMLACYQRALNAVSTEERLQWLMEAEAQLHGEFFEGWTPQSPEAHNWLLRVRADVRSRTLPPLLLLSDTLEQVGSLHGAFDVIRRILEIQPGHAVARQKAVRLADAVGQREVTRLLEQTVSFREATAKLAGGLDSAILADRRHFQQLFEKEIALLRPGERAALFRLSVLPAPFCAEIASQVCRTSLPMLNALAKTTLLDTEHDLFALPRPVRDCAWIKRPPTSRRRLQQLLTRFCLDAIMVPAWPENTLPSPFRSVEQAAPFLRQTLRWIEKQKPNQRYASFINMLRYYGVIDLAVVGVAYLEKTMAEPTMGADVRFQAGISIAYIRMHTGEHSSAIAPLESLLPAAKAIHDLPWLATISATLMMIYSNLEEWSRAQDQGLQALTYYRGLQERQGEAHCIRFLAEIDFQSGNLQAALKRCNEALAQCRSNPSHVYGIADALCWKATILCGLERCAEAELAIIEALSLWQDAGDTKVGLCLCVLGRIRASQQRFPEARAHLEYAIHLHQRTPMERHRIAAEEALGDLCHTTRRFPEALRLYRGCLDYYAGQSRTAGVERLRVKVQDCSEPVQVTGNSAFKSVGE